MQNLKQSDIKYLVSKGVNNDLKYRIDIFTQCYGCLEKFNRENLPNLLCCGHFICNHCLDQYKICLFCKCQVEKIGIQVKGFSQIVDIMYGPVNLQKKFTFLIKHQNGERTILRELSQDLTLEQVLKRIPKFQEFAKNDQYNAIINRKAEKNLFEKKYMKLKDIQQIFQLQYSRNNKANLIYIYKKRNGGDGEYNSFGVKIAEFNSFRQQLTKTFFKQAPDWRVIYQGANFQGLCKRQKKQQCAVSREKVWAKWGYGSWDIGLIARSKCPICKKIIGEVENIIFYKGKLKIKGIIQGSREQQDFFQRQFIHQGDNYLKTFDGKNQGNNVRWSSLIVTVDQL